MNTWLARIEDQIDALELPADEARDVYARTLRHRDNLMSRGGKRCTRCLKVRPLKHFAVSIYGEDGLARHCTHCEEAKA